MKIWNAIKAVKSMPKLKAMQSDLETQHQKAAGPKSCSVKMAYDHASANFKVGGAAYLRELCMSHANGIIHAASANTHFLAPSPETMAWGGFMGGETLTWVDVAAAEAAEEQVLDCIAKYA